ncbi:hypothetical protein [Cohnella algarum]|nr:hypothetical protein [Cohnella algarum]MBN2982263.1 hypothetical protein [Cohnella algarum]
MAESKRYERAKSPEDEEKLQDTFVTSIVIGLIILAIWFSIFFVYLDRL